MNYSGKKDFNKSQMFKTHVNMYVSFVKYYLPISLPRLIKGCGSLIHT